MDFLGLDTQQWLNLGIAIVTVVVTALAGRWIINFILNRIVSRLTGRTKTTLDDTIIEALRRPLYWFLVIFVAQSMVARLEFIPEDWESAVADIFFVLYFLTVFTLAWRLIAGLFSWYASEMTSRAEDPKLAKGLVGFFDRIVMIGIGILGLIVLLSHFGADVGGLVATLGVGSLAIALAAQAAFEDTISGFIIMIDQPFRVGDRIDILDINTWGDVVDIGLRSSRIRTRDNRMVIVPNSVLSKSLIVNHAYPNTEFRIQNHIGVAYGTDIEHARQVLVDTVSQVEGVITNMPDRPVEALFLEFGDSALVFRVRWWIASYVDTRRMFDKVNTALYYALNEAGIEIPFPQRDVHHKFDADAAAGLAGITSGRVDK